MNTGGRNRLADQMSPYLLQHAGNPVDWYPWGEEAFARARAEDRPVFLSIGYSTCHWCHVMERESFEDVEVAGLMNRAFVCIKVDREERPDIDHVYMTACQMMTGGGGWPLTILMTPEQRPFFAATYIPRAAMLTFVPRVEEAWRDDRGALVEDAARVTEALQRAMELARGDGIGEEVPRRAFLELSARFDAAHGGFGGRPKFPSPHNLLFLLRWWKRSGEVRALEMVEKTLEQMRRGGIYDQVGFGLHRYSTDARWLLPHFEKMLYDQALLVMALTEAFQASGREWMRDTALEVAAYVMRDLSSPAGGFHSAEDADSEGEEGKFYVWTRAELDAVLGGDAGFAAACYGVEDDGNFADEASGHRSNANVLHLPRSLDELGSAHGLDGGALRARLESVRARLFAVRAQRVRPQLDDKVLTDWNGLMIAALARAGCVFGRPDLVDRARQAADFIHAHLAGEDGSLRHRWRVGEGAIDGMLDDYAFLSWGLVELYEATFEEVFLARALRHARRMRALFEDADGGGFFMSAAGADSPVVRPREVYDGATPSGNSAAAMTLVRLARLTGDTALEDSARAVARAFAAQVASVPMGHTHMLSAADFMAGPSVEIVLAGRRGAPDLARLRAVIDGAYRPRTVVLFRPDEEPGPVVQLAPYAAGQVSLGGQATAYVCRDFACERPTTNADEFGRMLDASDG